MIPPHRAHREEPAGRGVVVALKRHGRRGGIEQVVEIKLTSEEKAALEKSVAAVRGLVDKLKL